MAGTAVEQCLDALPGPSTCMSDTGPVSTPAVCWRLTPYTPSWCRQRRNRGTPSHVWDRAEIPAVSGCTWTVCNRSDLAAVLASDQCNSYEYRHWACAGSCYTATSLITTTIRQYSWRMKSNKTSRRTFCTILSLVAFWQLCNKRIWWWWWEMLIWNIQNVLFYCK